MTPIRHTFDLIRQVEGLALRVPEDYLPAYDSTMARFWVGNTRAEARLRGLLDNVPCGRILAEQELQDLGLGFDDDRYGQLIFLMEPGTLVSPSDMGRITFAGMHGFHPQEDPHAYAVFLASESQERPVRHITEIYPAILADLRLT
jgi:hypothetical protein